MHGLGWSRTQALVPPTYSTLRTTASVTRRPNLEGAEVPTVSTKVRWLPPVWRDKAESIGRVVEVQAGLGCYSSGGSTATEVGAIRPDS